MNIPAAGPRRAPTPVKVPPEASPRGRAEPSRTQWLLSLQRQAGNRAALTAARHGHPADARRGRAAVQRSGGGTSALRAWLTAKSTKDTLDVVGDLTGLASTGAGSGQAVAPGETGVQEVQLSEHWLSRQDKESLTLIVQYRYVNEYMALVTGRRGGQAGATQDGGEQEAPSDAAQGQINEALAATVKANVQRGIERDLNRNQKTASNKTFVWSDSGSHTADVLGTVGEIMFTDVKGTFLRETLRLNDQARAVPGLELASEGESADARVFRGGRMVRGPNMSTGWNDNLAINLAGGAATIDDAGNDGHGIHVYDTAWNWDENTTRWAFEVQIDSRGMPRITARDSVGNPDDFSLW